MKKTKHKRGSVEAVLECAGLWKDIPDEDIEDIKRLVIKHRKSSTKRLLEKVEGY